MPWTRIWWAMTGFRDADAETAATELRVHPVVSHGRDEHRAFTAMWVRWVGGDDR